MQLTSTKNPLLQEIRRAAAGGRATEEGLIAVEGPHLLEEAMRGEWAIARIFVTPEGRKRHADLLQAAECEVVDVSARAFASTAATETSQEVLALVHPRDWVWDDLTRGSALVVILDGVQDPGNAGTIVRSAEAFGATGLVFLTGCARVANGKFLRATAGSVFRLPFLEGMANADLVRHVRASKLKFYALTPSSGARITEVDLRASCALAVGSEGAGVSSEILSEAQPVSIPSTAVESLNAAVACSIGLFMAQQQRNTA